MFSIKFVNCYVLFCFDVLFLFTGCASAADIQFFGVLGFLNSSFWVPGFVGSWVPGFLGSRVPGFLGSLDFQWFSLIVIDFPWFGGSQGVRMSDELSVEYAPPEPPRPYTHMAYLGSRVPGFPGFLGSWVLGIVWILGVIWILWVPWFLGWIRFYGFSWFLGLRL